MSDLDEYAEVMRGYVRAAKAGEERAARFLLEEFVSHADLYVRGPVQASDRVVLDFVVGAVRETLEGVEPRKALCLSSGERGRRPADSVVRNVRLALAVLEQVDALRASPALALSNVVFQAQKRVARQYAVKSSLVRSAWESLGAEAEVRRLRDEFFSSDEPAQDAAAELPSTRRPSKRRQPSRSRNKKAD